MMCLEFYVIYDVVSGLFYDWSTDSFNPEIEDCTHFYSLKSVLDIFNRLDYIDISIAAYRIEKKF